MLPLPYLSYCYHSTHPLFSALFSSLPYSLFYPIHHLTFPLNSFPKLMPPPSSPNSTQLCLSSALTLQTHSPKTTGSHSPYVILCMAAPTILRASKKSLSSFQCGLTSASSVTKRLCSRSHTVCMLVRPVTVGDNTGLVFLYFRVHWVCVCVCLCVSGSLTGLFVHSEVACLETVKIPGVLTTLSLVEVLQGRQEGLPEPHGLVLEHA